MNVQYHFIFGIVFATLLYFLFGPIVSILGLLIIFLSSFLIDIDHYFYYVYKKRNLNPIGAYKWYMRNIRKFRSMPIERRKQVYLGFCIFHGIEVLLILFVLGTYFFPLLNLVLIGFIFHLSTDLVSEIVLRHRIDKVSLIQTFLATRKLEHLDEIDIN